MPEIAAIFQPLITIFSTCRHRAAVARARFRVLFETIDGNAISGSGYGRRRRSLPSHLPRLRRDRLTVAA